MKKKTRGTEPPCLYGFDDVFPELFDMLGNRIGRDWTEAWGLQYPFCNVRNSSWGFRRPSTLDYQERLARIFNYLGGLAQGRITATEFEDRSERIRERVSKNRWTGSGAERGCVLPIWLPWIPSTSPDELFRLLVGPAVQSCIDYRRPLFVSRVVGNSVGGNVDIVPNLGAESLIWAMNRSSVVGRLYLSLQGFSILAQREQMENLPRYFILSGLDLLVALMGYPDVFLADRAPSICLSALSSKRRWMPQNAPDASIVLCAERMLMYENVQLMELAVPTCSGGLLVLG